MTKSGISPVLIKELRGRMRGSRAYLLLTAMVLLLSAVSYGLYRLARANALQYAGSGSLQALLGQSAFVGQNVFSGLVSLALFAICTIAPALTAWTISTEHERKTFDILMATPLRPAAVLFGKLAASLSYSALLVLAVVPLASLSYMFGGVTIIDMLQALLLLLLFALTFSVVGLFFSTLFRRSSLATVSSYAVLALFTFGTLFAYSFYSALRRQPPPNWWLALNPFSAMASALTGTAIPSGREVGLTWLFWGMAGSGLDRWSAVPAPIWRYTAGIYAWLTLILYLLSTQLVKPMRRFRPVLQVTAVGVLFIVISILAGLFLYSSLKPAQIFAWLRWNLSAGHDLIVNSKFAAGESAWSVSTNIEDEGESAGEVKVIAEGSRQVLSFARAGRKSSEIDVAQVVDQPVPQDGWLKLRVVLRVDSQDVPVCGVLGSECPVMIKLYYDDAFDGTHEWFQGFYADSRSGYPTGCRTCESKQQHIRVKLGEWYTYESPNLIQDMATRKYPLPRAIRFITIAAAGHTYKSQVAEVALLTREGQPLDWRHIFNKPTPTPFVPVVPTAIWPLPPPTPAPTPTPMRPPLATPTRWVPVPLAPTLVRGMPFTPTPAPTRTPWSVLTTRAP